MFIDLSRIKTCTIIPFTLFCIVYMGDNMLTDIFCGIMLPLLGTAAGSACVYFMKGSLGAFVQKALSGFAAGVMMAASVWSLIIPAIDRCENLGGLAFLPAVLGFWSGILFLLAVDRLMPQISMHFRKAGDRANRFQGITMLVFAVVLHNLPEGMAVGAVYSAILSGDENVSLSTAFALSLGIAIQNFPEGAIISMPLKAHGMKKNRAFAYGALSGVVEPLGAFITILLSVLVVPLLPLFLSFAAGAMVYVVVRELIPGLSDGESALSGVLFFACGFSVMMALDVALG